MSTGLNVVPCAALASPPRSWCRLCSLLLLNGLTSHHDGSQLLLCRAFSWLFWWLWRAEENSVLLRLLPSHRVLGSCWFLSLGSFIFPHLCVGGIYLGTVTGNPYVKFLPLPFCRFPGRSLLAQFAWGKQLCKGRLLSGGSRSIHGACGRGDLLRC